MQTDNSLDILDLATRIELLAEQIYCRLASHFETQPKVRDGFLKLSAEERQHASRIRLLRAEYARESHGYGRLEVPVGELQSLIATSESVIDQLNGPPLDLDLDSVMKTMLEFEEATAALHAENLAGVALPNTSTFFQMLANQDREHATFLQSVRPG